MKKSLIPGLLLLIVAVHVPGRLPPSVEGKGKQSIRDIQSMAELVPCVDDTTLLVLDLDNTLIEPVGNLGSDQWYYYLVRKYQEVDRLSQKKAEAQAMELWNKVQWLIQIKAVEPDTPRIIRRQQDRGIKVLGLTARTPDIANRTLAQLKSVGIDLGRSTVSGKEVELKAEEIFRFQQGVLFVGEMNDKGKTLVQFLGHVKNSPKKVVFVDDKEKHIRNMARALAGTGIVYVGLRYGAADNKVNAFHKDMKDIALFTLGQLSEKAAADVEKAMKR